MRHTLQILTLLLGIFTISIGNSYELFFNTNNGVYYSNNPLVALYMSIGVFLVLKLSLLLITIRF